MDDAATQDMHKALEALASMLQRSENAQKKLAEGTSQHTLQKNRIQALTIASSLIQAQLAGQPMPGRYTRQQLEAALAPLASLTSKSEKAQAKLAPGSWQHTMLQNNLNALRLAAPLLTKALAPAPTSCTKERP